MREVGVLEAKTHFTSLIAEVEWTGEAVIVTRHGKAAVRIVPMTGGAAAPSQTELRSVAEKVLAWRDAQPVDESLKGMSWEELKRQIRDEDSYD